MKIKTKTLVLTTVGAFALSYAILGSNAFADTSTGSVPAVPSVTVPTPSSTSPTPLISPIQAPAGITSPSAGITQDGEDDDFDDLSDDVNEVDDIDDEISGDDSDDQLTTSTTVDDVNQSGDTEGETGEDD